MWDYKKADEKSIRKALDLVNWGRLFYYKNIDSQVMTLNETISKIKTRNKLYKQYIENSRFESDFMMIETLITEINDLITSTKDLY